MKHTPKKQKTPHKKEETKNDEFADFNKFESGSKDKNTNDWGGDMDFTSFGQFKKEEEKSEEPVMDLLGCDEDSSSVEDI